MIDKYRRESLRGFARAGLGMLAVGAVVTRASAQDAKVAQNLVQYQQTPKDGQECDKCVNWVPPNSCKIVAGTISPKGYCIAYAPKEG
jgi:hypothetical protein